MTKTVTRKIKVRDGYILRYYVTKTWLCPVGSICVAHRYTSHNILGYRTSEAIGDRTPHACRRYTQLHHRSTGVSEMDGYITAARTLQNKHTNFIISSKPVHAEKGAIHFNTLNHNTCDHVHIPCLLSCVLSFRICVVFNSFACTNNSAAHLLLQHNQKQIRTHIYQHSEIKMYKTSANMYTFAARRGSDRPSFGSLLPQASPLHLHVLTCMRACNVESRVNIANLKLLARTPDDKEIFTLRHY